MYNTRTLNNIQPLYDIQTVYNIIHCTTHTCNLISNGNSMYDFYMDDFWNTHIYASKHTHIGDIKTKNIVDKLKSYKKLPVSEPYFKLSNHEINYLKLHSDCIYEYHLYVKNIIANHQSGMMTLHNNCEDSHKNTCAETIYTRTQHTGFSEFIDANINDFIGKLNMTEKMQAVQTLGMDIQMISKLIDDFTQNVLLSDISKPVLICDVSNILKNPYIHEELEKIYGKKYNQIFKTWNEGYSDYSTKSTIGSNQVNCVEPYTSLNIDVDTKLFVIKTIHDMFLSDFVNIFVMTDCGENYDLESIDNLQLSNSLFVILNDANDTYDIFREHDDVIMLLLYEWLNVNNISSKILSLDKFKWFDNYKTLGKTTFIYEYDFDLGMRKLILSKQNVSTNMKNIYKIYNESQHFMLGSVPVLTEDMTHIVISDKLTDMYGKNTIYGKYLRVIKMFLLNDLTFDKYERLLKSLVTDTKVIGQSLKNVLMCINKKNAITQLSYINTDTDPDTDMYTYTSIDKQMLSFIDIHTYIEQYKIIVKIYPFIRMILYKSNIDEKLGYIHVSFFTEVLVIFDLLHENVGQLRKLSFMTDNKKIIKIAKQLFLMYMYVKKQGFLKKGL